MGQHVYEEVEAALASLVPYNSVFEIRLFAYGRKRTDSGYFNSPAAAASVLAGLQNEYKGIYVTPNPVNPDLFARSANRITQYAEATTLDPQVVARRWILADIDFERPSGIGSTDEQHEAALAKARQIAGIMWFEYGWCTPMLNDSGNGAHLLWPIELPNNEEVRDAIAKFLKCLDARFGEPGRLKVDVMNFNAARIWRLPGTWARKGDSTPERPHRKAKILEPLNHLDSVTLEQIQAFNAQHEYLLGGRSQTSQVPQVQQALAPDAMYKHLNDHAMRRIPEWVPEFFPDARPYKEGFRVSSNDLGRMFEEELTIHPFPLGIKDFGPADQGDPREGRRTPVQIIAEFCTDGDVDLAARKLADTLHAPLTEFTAIAPPVLTGLDPINGSAKAKYTFAGLSSFNDLRQETFKEQKWIIKDVLPTGAYLLAARPKMKKTWLALQLGKAVSIGGKFLDWECTKADVLGLWLEDNKRRLRARMDTLSTFDMSHPDLSGFRYYTGGMSINGAGHEFISNPEEQAEVRALFPRGQAGVDALYQFVELHPKTKLIIIDTYAHFREKSNERDIYQRDYDAAMPITRFAADTETCVICVTHEKKGLANSEDSGDFMEDVTGSAGNTGGFDGVCSIKGKRGVQEVETRKFLLSGRDVPHDFELDMVFDAQRGGWLPAPRQELKVQLRALFERNRYINQQELAALLPNVPRSRLTRALIEMKFDGELSQTKFGYEKAQRLN